MSCWSLQRRSCVKVKRPSFSSRNDGKAQRRAVQIGIADETHVEIVSGVKAGETVIVEGQVGLPDEAAITTDHEEDAAEGPEPGAATPKDDAK